VAGTPGARRDRNDTTVPGDESAKIIKGIGCDESCGDQLPQAILYFAAEESGEPVKVGKEQCTATLECFPY
jgi:hypothetical protein